MNKKMILAIGAAAVSLTMLAGTPAMAAGRLAQAYIGARPAVGISNTYELSYDQKTRVVLVTTRFSEHKPNSVKVTTVELCYSGPLPSAIFVTPQLKNSGGNVWDGGSARRIYSGACSTWNVNRTYYKQSDGGVVQVNSRVTDNGPVLLIAGYKR